MKLLLELLFISSVFANEPSCSAHLSRTFGLQSRTHPNNKNTLCPFIKKNCCTNKDIVYILKWY